MNTDEIKRFFQNDQYLVLTGVEIEEVKTDWCRCSLKVEDKHINATGAVQGGAIYTLADSAFAVACNSRHLIEGDGKVTVSQSASISYISAGKPGSMLFAEARKTGGGKRTSVYQITVTDNEDRVIAIMTGNGFIIEKKSTTPP